MSYSGITFVAIDVAHQGNIDKLDGNWSSKDITDASSQVHLKEILEQLGITGDFGTWLAALIGGVATRLTDNKSDWETIDHEKGVLEKVADAAAWVGNHVDLSATICLGYCLGIGTQGATVYMQTGWGCCFLSGSVGVSTKEYRDRSCETAVAGGNLGPVGVSTQVGNSSNDYELAWSPGLGYGAALITNHDVLGTRYC